MAKKSFFNSQNLQRWGLQGFFRLSSSIAPDLAAQKGLDLFLRPQRHRRPGWEQDLLAQGERIDFPQGVAVWRFGHGPKRALLVHGWDGRGSQLGRFVPALLEAGYEVILFDFPAHGDSDGKQTHLREWISLLGDVAESFGKIDAVIAHSLGGTATLLAAAMDTRLKPSAIVVIGSPNYIADIFQGFYRLVGMRGKARQQFEQKIFEKTQIHPRRDFPTSFASLLQVPLLIVHDQDDDAVHFDHAEQLMREIPQARLLKTQGLGHRRILKSEEVVEDIVDFLFDILSSKPKTSSGTQDLSA
jgi:alpha-beta hydrolase superfamily lysophospholipase